MIYEGYIIKQAKQHRDSKKVARSWNIIEERTAMKVKILSFRGVDKGNDLARCHDWIDKHIRKVPIYPPTTIRELYDDEKAKEIIRNMKGKRVPKTVNISSIDASFLRARMSQVWEDFADLPQVAQVMMVPLFKQWEEDNKEWIDMIKL